MIRRYYISFLFLLVASSGSAQKTIPTISSQEINNFIGCWTGTINHNGTIIRKPYSVAADLIVKQIDKTDKFELVNIYSKDSLDNTHDTISISKDGRKLNNAAVQSKHINREGSLVLITAGFGFDHDNNKNAVIKSTYIIGKTMYTYKKEIQLEGENDWMERETNNYSRKPCEEKNIIKKIKVKNKSHKK